jgi:hypothetical protein
VSLTPYIICIHIYSIGSRAWKVFQQSSTADHGDWLTLLLRDRFEFLQSTHVLERMYCTCFRISRFTTRMTVCTQHNRLVHLRGMPSTVIHSRPWRLAYIAASGRNSSSAHPCLGVLYLFENARFTYPYRTYPAKSIGSCPRKVFPQSSTARIRYWRIAVLG